MSLSSDIGLVGDRKRALGSRAAVRRIGCAIGRRWHNALMATPEDFADRRQRIVKGVALVISLVASAGLLAAAIRSPDHPWLGWISLLPLLQCIRRLKPGLAMGCGVLWGTSLFVLSMTAGDTPIPVTWLSLLLLAVVPGAYACVGALVTRRFGFSVLFLAFAWIGAELALIPLALHKGLLAGTQPSGGYAHVVEGLLGYVWVSFLVAYINAALHSVLTHVCKAGAGSRLVKRAGDSPRRLFPLEVGNSLRDHLIHSLQARAPPLALS